MKIFSLLKSFLFLVNTQSCNSRGQLFKKNFVFTVSKDIVYFLSNVSADE